MWFAKITLCDHGSYVQKLDDLARAIEGELDCIIRSPKLADAVTLTVEAVEMTQEEYEALPEFTGH